MCAGSARVFFYFKLYYTMAKVNSILGKMTGKLGSIVTSSVGGTVVAREYNPNVSNPNTVAQVNQRAKLKLMSQIAASLAPVIVIPKEGLKSSRNLFIKKNFDSVYASGGVAAITYENLQLTNGNAGLPSITVRRSTETGISVSLDGNVSNAVSRVVYILYAKTSEATLQYVQSVIVDEPGDEGTFPGTLLYTAGDIVVFAYGMKDMSGSASAKYSNYSVESGVDVARLTMVRSLSMSDFQFTQTRGTTLFADETESTSVPDGQARVYVTAVGPGSVSGAGTFTVGSNVTVVATPNTGMTFNGWKVNGNSTIISTSASYTFLLQGQTDLVAEFINPRETSGGTGDEG